MPDPDIMADADVMPTPPFEELSFVTLAWKIRAGAIGEVRLRGPVHGVIARVDPCHRRDRAELPDRRIGDLGVVHDVGIIVQCDLVQNRARADFAIGTEPGAVQFGRWIDGRFDGKYFAGHANFHEQWMLIRGYRSGPHVIDVIDDKVVTAA